MVQAVVLAGGWGRRLGPITARRPKPLIPVAGKRVIDYTLEDLASARPDEATVIVDPRALPLHGLPGWARAVAQEGPGLSRALRQASRIVKESAGDLVVASFTGYLAKPGGMARRVLDYYSISEYPAVIAVAPVSTGLETFGFVELGPQHSVARVSRELEEWRGGRGYVFAGMLVADRKIIRDLGEAGGFMEALNTLAKRRLLGAYIWPGDWLEIAYPWDLLETPRIVLAGSSTSIHPRARIAATARLGMGVLVDEGAVIGEGAVVHGPSYIGKGVEVADGAVIGPGTMLEQGVRVEEHATVRESVVLERATIESGARLYRSVVGEEARVEAHTYTLAASLEDPGPCVRRLIEARAYRITSLFGSIIAPGARVTQCSRLQPHRIIA